MVLGLVFLLAAAGDCANWARSFGDWLEERTERTNLPLPADPAPVVAKGTRPPQGIPVAISKDAAFVGARKVTSQEMTDAIKALGETHAKVSPEPPVLLLLVHADAPWSR